MNQEKERGRRNSRDEVLNGEGKELIDQLNKTELRILNGVSEGDKEGDYTYLGSIRHVIIDYVIRNKQKDK